MQYYLAPLEGLTTYIFRNVYHHFFGKADQYFTPFLSNKKLSSREKNDILPEHNEGIPLVPQILTNRPEEFLSIAGQLKSYGYSSVNLNLGCPSGTVTAKGRGAGFLAFPEKLDAFLNEIFEHAPLSVSVKTRIGISSAEEWETLLDIYAKYPMEELILHPRLQKQFYSGTPHLSAFAAAKERLSVPLCYNGDITSAESEQQLLQLFSDTDRIMIGRGILRNPFLIQELRHDTVSSDRLDILREFHDEVYSGYRSVMSGEQPVLYKMKDLWTFLIDSFPEPERKLKKIRKADHFSDYEIAVRSVFSGNGFL